MIRGVGLVPQAKVLLNARFQTLSCDRSSPPPESLLHCGTTALALQALDPNEGAGEAALVRWIEDFLPHLNPPRPEPYLTPEGLFTPEYEAWSKKHGWSASEAGSREVGCSLHLRLLAYIGDPKLLLLFRRAIKSNSDVIIDGATLGLALLGDKASILAILAAAEKKTEIEFEMVLFELHNFGDAGVDRLILGGT